MDCWKPKVAVPNLVSPYTFARILWGYLPRRRTAMDRSGRFSVRSDVGVSEYQS